MLTFYIPVHETGANREETGWKRVMDISFILSVLDCFYFFPLPCFATKKLELGCGREYPKRGNTLFI